MADRAGVFFSDWRGYDWTPWVPFSGAMDAVPDRPGLYRIRPVGREMLMYIGWTGGSLRQCFAGIRLNTAKTVMPWNDPWPVAPALWAWKDAKGYAYEFSSAVLSDTIVEMRAAECSLLCHYRLEFHESPLCSFGRFHRKYRRPSDRKDGVPGGRLGPGEPLNPAGGPSASPLAVTGTPGEPGWMGLAWSPRQSPGTVATVPAEQGYYLIFDAATGDMLAIGQSEDCARTLSGIMKNPWDNRDLVCSFACEPGHVPAHNLRERETDLIGNYIDQHGTVPEYQFLDSADDGAYPSGTGSFLTTG
jgi:hypothetical protein